MSDQLTFQFGVDASRVIAKAEEAGRAAGKIFGDAFNKQAESTLEPMEVQLEVDFKGGEQVNKFNRSMDTAKQRAAAMDEKITAAQKKTAAYKLEVAKAANKQQHFNRVLGRTPLKATASQIQGAINKLKMLQAQTKKNSESFKRLGNAIIKMKGKLNQVKGSGGAMGALGTVMQGLTAKFALANVAAGLVTDGIRSMGQKVGETLDAMTERSKNIEALTLALQNSGVAGEDIQKVFGSIKATALTFGVRMDDLGAAWKRLGPTVLAAGGTLKDVENVIVSMSARTVGLGLSGEQTARYMEALAQVIGKGKLQGEELTKQLSQLDGALRSQIEQDLKSVIPEFTNLEDEMRKGAVTADMFTESFIRVSKDAVKNLTGEMFAMQSAIKASGDATGLTLQQIENKINTLNTLSLDGFSQVFDSTGKLVLRIQASIAQFFAKIATDMPNVMAAFKIFVDICSNLFEIIWNLGTIALVTLFDGLDAILGIGAAVTNFFLNMIPKGLRDQITGLGESLMNLGRRVFDAFMGSGEAFKSQISFLEDVDNKLKDTTTNYEKLAETIKGALEGELSTLQNISDALVANYKEEADQIKENIALLDEQAQTERDRHTEANQLIKDKYQTQKDELDEIRQRLEENYEIEMQRINALTPAEQELARLRRAELEAKARNGNLSRKERLEAQASLDRMDRRIALQNLNKRKKEEELGLTSRPQLFRKKETRPWLKKRSATRPTIGLLRSSAMKNRQPWMRSIVKPRPCRTPLEN